VGPTHLVRAGGDAEADYVAVLNRCPKLFNGETVKSISLNDASTVATVTLSVSADEGGGTTDFEMIYEGGFWKHQPSDITRR
jgi:hypothetical protein